MSDQDPSAEGGSGIAFGADLIIPVLAAVFTVYFLVSSSDLVWEARANGTVIGGVLLTLIAVEVVRIFLQWRAGAGTFGFGDIAVWNESQAKRFWLIVILSLFIATIPWLGTTLGLFLVMTASMWVLGVRNTRNLVTIAFVTSASVYILFIAILETRLPPGPVEKLLAPLLHSVN